VRFKSAPSAAKGAFEIFQSLRPNFKIFENQTYESWNPRKKRKN
jgi:hypothetical protein